MRLRWNDDYPGELQVATASATAAHAQWYKKNDCAFWRPRDMTATGRLSLQYKADFQLL